MTQTENPATQPQPPSLVKRMVVGYLIGLAAISWFLIGSGGGDPAWGPYWMIRPLVITPLAGATGGLCNYFLLVYRESIGFSKAAAVITSVMVFIVGLWMGVVLGLDTTMWD